MKTRDHFLRDDYECVCKEQKKLQELRMVCGTKSPAVKSKKLFPFPKLNEFTWRQDNIFAS